MPNDLLYEKPEITRTPAGGDVADARRLGRGAGLAGTQSSRPALALRGLLMAIDLGLRRYPIQFLLMGLGLGFGIGALSKRREAHDRRW